MQKIYALLFLSLFAIDLKASHLVGGDISYTHVSGMTYKVRLKLHRDCSGATLGTTETISIVSPSLSANSTVSLSLLTSGVINTYCASAVTTCTNPSSPNPGFEYYVYEGNITTSGAASDWRIAYSNCCRNAAINNLNIPSSQSFYVFTTLNNLSSPGNFNNSANFLLDNSVRYAINQTYVINQSAIDIDGDSLHYSLVAPLSNFSTPCTYAAGYSVTSPFGSAGSISINPLNGDITFNNMMVSNNAIAIKVDEYRSGQLIATSIRDMQFMFANGTPGNLLPALSGVNGGANYYTSLNLCPSSTLSFTVNGTDANLTDSVHVNVTGTDITGYNVISNGALQETITFSWTPSASDIRPQPYLLVLEAMDSYCAKISRGYLIYINQCNQDSVWAGDANADYVVNNYDVLNIGIANGTTGVIRPGATTNWVAEYCPDWTNSFMSGVNYKHADCDGNGTIDAADLNAVSLNYGQFHIKTGNASGHKTAGFPDLYFDLSGVAPIAGTTIQIPVMLGSSGSVVNSIYGIAAHINVSNTVSNPVSLNNSTCWLGNASNSFFFTKDISLNDIAFTIVRKDQVNTNGYGQIGQLSIPIAASATPNSDLRIHFTDVTLILNDGSELTDFNIINDTLKIQSPNSIADVKSLSQLLIAPNPVTDKLEISLPEDLSGEVEVVLMDMTGRIVVREHKVAKRGTHLTMQTNHLAHGQYALQVRSAGRLLTGRLTK